MIKEYFLTNKSKRSPKPAFYDKNKALLNNIIFLCIMYIFI